MRGAHITVKDLIAPGQRHIIDPAHLIAPDIRCAQDPLRPMPLVPGGQDQRVIDLAHGREYFSAVDLTPQLRQDHLTINSRIDPGGFFFTADRPAIA